MKPAAGISKTSPVRQIYEVKKLKRLRKLDTLYLEDLEYCLPTSSWGSLTLTDYSIKSNLMRPLVKITTEYM